MTIIGVDPGLTYTGVAVIKEKKEGYEIKTWKIKPKGEELSKKLSDLVSKLLIIINSLSFTDEEEKIFIVEEPPLYVRREGRWGNKVVSSILKLTQAYAVIWGALRYLQLHRYNIEIKTIPAPTMRRKGLPTKQRAKEVLMGLLPDHKEEIKKMSEHEGDALMMAWWEWERRRR